MAYNTMKKILFFILLFTNFLFAESMKLEDDSKMGSGTITNWETLGGADANDGTGIYINFGCHSYERFLVWYDTSFTENIQAGTLWVKLFQKNFFASDDDTLQTGTAWVERPYYEGITSDPADSAATWSHYDYDTDAWTTPGALGSGDTTGTYFVGEEYSYLGTNPDIDTWIGIPVCSSLSSWPPSGVTGLLIYAYKCVGGGYFRFYSDDHGTTANRPYIEFTYTVGDGEAKYLKIRK